jgi:glucan phosphoethanolaminetransferase (alkaline phosphatase superfamily)
MRSLLRLPNIYLLATYLILSAMPFVPMFFGKAPYHPSELAYVEIVVWLSAWAIFKRPVWFHWLLLPAFLALPVEIYLQYFYGQGISTHHLGIIAETSPKEAMEFLGKKVVLLVLTLVAVIVWWATSWYAAFRTRSLDWAGKSRWLALGLLTVAAGLWTYAYEVGVMPKPAAPKIASASKKDSSGKIILVNAGNGSASSDEDDSDDESDDSAAGSASATASVASTTNGWHKLPYWANVPLDSENFGQTWPFGLVVRGYDFWKERKYLSELAHRNSEFKFGAHQVGLADTPQIVVMVIGESSRYDRWSLNGYKRETNPLLSKEENLVSLSNVVTPVSATRLSVPIIVSRKPATQSLKAGFSEKSFLTAFKEAGFKTFWLSNQMSFGQFDTPVSVFAKEADVIQFLNLGGFQDNSSYDDILLNPLKAALADPAQKKLIVLHTLGNHWNYSHRHPKEFDRWKPSLFGVANPEYTDLAIKEQLNNSYDNSILYTDWFLSQVINTLKATDKLTSMMYVSDHGQTLYDGACNLAFHGHNTAFEFHIPALVWYSDQYKKTFPQKVEQLLRHRRSKLSTENVFHSLLDMAEVHYDSEHLEWSILSKKLKSHKRYVDSYGWTDYDNATLKGDCKEVIDRGTPLVQER